MTSSLGTDRSSTAPILHVDMDAFFASVELRERPELAGQPVIIGGLGPRSVVVSATYEARALGVKAAMPMGQATRLAPGAEVIPPTPERYREVSRNVMAILGSYTPVIEQLSVDEAFLDVSGALRRLGTPQRIAEQIRHQVFAEQSITCSVGAAATKFVAKIASTRAKPNGLLVVPKDQTLPFLHPLPIEALWGVGAKTAKTLHRLGIRTVRDVAELGQQTLVNALGQAAGQHVWLLAQGIDDRPVARSVAERSVGSEETFGRDVCDESIVFAELLRLCDRVASTLRAEGQTANTVVLKVRYSDFTTVTRSRTMNQPTDVSRDLYQTVQLLWAKMKHKSPWIRLLGVRCENLRSVGATDFQPMLGEREKGWREAEAAIDKARSKFGRNSLTSASLIGQAAPHNCRD